MYPNFFFPKIPFKGDKKSCLQTSLGMSLADSSIASEREVEFAPSPKKDNRNFCVKLYDAINASIPGPVKIPKEYQGLDYTYGTLLFSLS